MKKLFVQQFGEETVLHYRYFIAEVPEGMDAEELKGNSMCSLLQELADRKGIEWEFYESNGISADCCSAIDEVPGDDDASKYAVVEIAARMLTAARTPSNAIALESDNASIDG